MNGLIKNLFLLFTVFLFIAAIFSLYNPPSETTQAIGLNIFLQQIANEEIRDIAVEGNQLKITLNSGQLETLQKETSEPLSDLLKNYNVAPEKLAKINIQVKDESGWDFWLKMLLPFLIPFLFIAGFIYFMMKQAQGANNRAMMFGQAKAKEPEAGQKEKITFNEVAGIKEAKEELAEVVEFLKTPKKFLKLGAKIPKGVLVVGPPGTGKTLLAKAVAGEANVPFFSISGSEFVEMFVGVGASRVRSLFQKAKKHAPCIIFIDEIDAVGRHRGAGLGGSHDEREQTLNQILVEMDGFDPNANIIIMAATNRPDILDVALLRPGRFDRRVVLGLPDISEREAILKVHARQKPLAESVDLRRVAERTPGFSGADLANLLNEAAILAARRDKTRIDQLEVLDSIEKVMMGPERRSRLFSDEEKKITAYHEAGHALVSHELPGVDPVQKISIISRGSAAGYTLKLPETDKYFHKKSEFINELAVLLGGFVTEKEIFGEVTTGATNDLRHATDLARRIITEYGMSDRLGPRTFGKKEELIFLGREISEHRDYSEKTAEAIDKEINGLINQAGKTAQQIIKQQKNKLVEIAKILLAKESMEKEEFEAIFQTGPTVAKTA
ncbi:MAG: ATP-dependent zinc metalloprotease FtsH [bacterium]